MNDVISKKATIDYNLESLRGFAALFVVISHLIFHHKFFDPVYFPSFLKAFDTNSHLCVLIFFMLSGYVIGISNKAPLTSEKIFTYIKKRILRIYPIYFISIIFTAIIATSAFTILCLIGNLFFLQGLVVNLIFENSPAWSLNYEVIYYLLFIPISYFKIDPIVAILSSIAIGLTIFFTYPTVPLPIVSAYLFGMVFWNTGLYIARNINIKDIAVSYNTMVSNIFLILSLSSFTVNVNLFNILTNLLFKQPIKFPSNIYWVKTMITFNDLAYLPFCIMFILNFTTKTFKFKKLLALFVQFLPLLSVYPLLKAYTADNSLQFIVSSIYYLISTILFFLPVGSMNKISSKIINLGIWFGSISYGLYIIHFPILYAFGRVQFFNDGSVAYVIRLILFLSVTLYVSYLLEKRLQPLIKKFFLT